MAGIRTIGIIIPSLGVGGAERVVAILAEALSRDFAVHILMSETAEVHFPVAGAVLHRIPLTREGIPQAVERLGIDLVLDHYHWDPGHVRLMGDLADAGLSVVLTEHNAWHYPLFQWARDAKQGSETWFTDRYEIHRKFAAVTVLNDDAFRYFSQHLDNVRTLPNPVTPGQSNHSSPGSRRLLTISHFRKRAKRLDLLYQAFAQLRGLIPEAELTVLGDYDALQDRYCRLTAGLGDAVISTPGRSSQVDRYLEGAALFALTSEIEGQPMVLLEAARQGLPQIAFDLPGLRDQLVHGETGLLVPFGDTGAFAEAAAGLMRDEPRLRRMGAAARELVLRDFSLPTILARWHGLIAEIAERGRISTEAAPLPEALVRADGRWRDHWRAVERHDDATQVPKVSFLVPVFGTEALLGRCLRSIQAQTLAEFECIVVDDASPGDVQGVVRDTVGTDARFRVLTHPVNRGLYQARSTAARAARGLFYAHIDSDDYIHPRFAETLFTEAATTGAEIVECKAIELREDGRPIRFNEVYQEGPVDGVFAARDFFANRLRNVVWNKLYSRDLWHRAPEHMQIDLGLSICEDLLRNALIFPECRRYSAVEDCLYFYCRRPSSVVKGGDLSRLVQKLGDVDFAYAKASARQTGPGQAEAWARLQARHAEDVQWYVGEYLDRHDFDQVMAEMRGLGDRLDPGIAVLLHLVRGRGRLKAEQAGVTQAWQRERNRANQLETRLADLGRAMER